ncbi:MAG: MFS transporter [Streptosporangiaceae bacterium]|nr:MFS transporter [Streptosporangiaceae bacterium]
MIAADPAGLGDSSARSKPEEPGDSLSRREKTFTQRPSRPDARAWMRIAFAMFAVGWGANQFSPMLIVYRHELNLSAAAVAGLFVIYAATLVPGLLVGGPASDRYGRRLVLVPFVVLSPVATLLLIVGPRDLAVIAAGRALAGLCSGVVFSSATAWVQDLSLAGNAVAPYTGADPAAGARRAALALTAGFGLGPVVAAGFAQWAGDPLQVPYLPHLVIGAVAAVAAMSVPGARAVREPAARRGWPPTAVRSWRFWLAVAPGAPLVFGSISLAIVVLPEDVTSAKTLSAGFAGLMTMLAFTAGVAAQSLARRIAAANGLISGLACAAVGTGLGVAAVYGGQDRAVAGLAAVFLGAAYGLCLVCGLRQAERLASASDRGAVVACYYALAYVGFAAPYLAAGLGALAGKAAALAILAIAALVLSLWTAGYAAITGVR